MKFINAIFNFYINASIHVALAVYALIRITELYFNLPYNEPLDYFVFYGSITGYNFVKYAGIAKLHHISLTKNLRLIQLFSLLCFVAMMYYGLQLPVDILLYFLPFGLLTLLYAVPLFKGLTLNLRGIASLKIVIIALVWTGVTLIIPLLHTEKPVDTNFVLAALQRFLFVIVLTLPFDIRDLRFDKRKLQTIPQLIGVERTKKLGFILLAITIVIEFFITPNAQFKLGYSVLFLVLLIFLQRAQRKQSTYYASFWVEGIPIFWWLFLIVLTQAN